MKTVGLNVESYHSGLTPDERRKLSKRFQDKVYGAPGGCDILVCSIFVSVAGKDWQKNCRNVVLTTVPPSSSYEYQAVGRVLRLAQRGRFVRVIRLQMETGYSDKLVRSIIIRSIPAFVAFANAEVLGEQGEAGDLEITSFRVLDGVPYPLDNERVAGKTHLEMISPEAGIQRLIKIQSGRADGQILDAPVPVDLEG